MPTAQRLLIELVAKADSVEKTVSGLDSGLGRIGGTLGKIGGAVAGAFAVGAVVDFGKQAVSSFSNLEQSIGGVEAVFGTAQETVKAFGESAAESAGLATSEYNTLATQLGGVIKGSGAITDVQQLATETQSLITVAADLAATYGGTTQQAVEALGSAFRGEADPAERFNLNLKASQVSAKAAELGLVGAGGAITEAGKAQAIMALITEQSKDSLGQFGKEADSVAGQQARLTAKWENAQAQIGQALLPIVLKLFGALEPLIPVIVGIVDELAPLIEVAAEVVGPLAELALSILPILTEILVPLVRWILPYLVDLVDELAMVFGMVADAVADAVDWFKKLKPPAWLQSVGSTLGDIFGGSRSTTTHSATRSLSGSTGFATLRAGLRTSVGPGGVLATSGGPSIIINTGVGDPVSIGREVVEAISSYERANGTRWRT
jgi:hypothetical protein